MIKRFPSPLQIPATPVVEEAPALHLASRYEIQEDHYAWVRWMFQSARLRGGALMFVSPHTDRRALLRDWETFVRNTWLPVIAPVMLRGWQAAMEDNDEVLWGTAEWLVQKLDRSALERSVESGRWLLDSTRGAKYQGSLGRLRQKTDAGEIEPHLPMVWAAVAALFQLPALDMLMAVVAEEWRAGNSACLQHAEPQGPLSFSALAAVALRSSPLLRTTVHGN